MGILPAPEHGQDGHGTLPDGHGTSPGFSLLEMMAVVNLILLLAVFALPGFHSVMVHSHEVVLRENPGQARYFPFIVMLERSLCLRINLKYGA